MMLSLTQYQQSADALEDFDCPSDTNFLQFARQYDHAHAQQVKHSRRKVLWQSVIRTAAAFCVCIVIMGSLTLTTSQAARQKAFHLLFNDQHGSANLQTIPPSDVLAEWENYWYPGWLPEEFELVGAEAFGPTHILRFVATGLGATMLIYEQPLNTTLGIDTDTTIREEVMIGDSYGQLFRDTTGDGNRLILVWETDTNILQLDMDGGFDVPLLTKIAENMQYYIHTP